MSLFLGCCSQNFEKNENGSTNIENNNKKIGKERILRLNYQENFSENIKYFKISSDKNIYENEMPQDIFNLQQKNKMFDFSNLCIFCGGINCSSEKYIEEKKYKIKGLICELYYDCIFASQRPSTELIKKYNLIQNFKANNIKLIINCEIHGEHPKCGPNKGLEQDSGYTYIPSCFIEEGINYLNSGFVENDSPPTLDFMLDIVKKISYVIKYEKGKVLVHGHSMDGRCCLVIACFSIFYFNKNVDEAIKDIRKKRNNAINNSSQEDFCRRFEIYINMLKYIFPRKKISVDKYIKYQNDIEININQITIPNFISDFFNSDLINDHDLSEIININYIPKIIVRCLEQILYLKNKNKIKNEELYHLLNQQNKISKDEIKQILLIKKELNENIWDLFDKNENLLITIELLFNWLEYYVIKIINPDKITKLFKNNITEIFKDNYQIESEQLIELIKEIKVIFSKVEYETIKYISIFISLIYPINKNEKIVINNEINEFRKFLYRLLFLFFGFNCEKLNDLSLSNDSKEILTVKNFILILDFFIFFSSKKEKTITKFDTSENDWLNDYLNMKKIFEQEDNINKEENDILLFFKYKPKMGFLSIKSLL